MKRSEMSRRSRNTGPTAEVVDLVVARDHGCCAVCGEQVRGTRGIDWSVQHRLRRGAGSTRRPWVNLPGNLILACGSGTTDCHGYIENHPASAETFGYRVLDGVTPPSATPVLHAGHDGWVLLADDGTWEAA